MFRKILSTMLLILSAITQHGHAQLIQPGTTSRSSAGAGSRNSDSQLLAQQAVSPSYRIGAGDLIAISVYQEDDLSTTVRVGETGAISFPLVGTIRIGGMSAQQATNEIAAQLRDGYLVNPVVTVSLVEQTKAKFTILGQVSKPGPYEMPANGAISFMEAIGMAGGFTRIASPSKCTVKRSSGELIRVNGKEQAAGDKQAVFKILPGDVITIPESLF